MIIDISKLEEEQVEDINEDNNIILKNIISKYFNIKTENQNKYKNILDSFNNEIRNHLLKIEKKYLLDNINKYWNEILNISNTNIKNNLSKNSFGNDFLNNLIIPDFYRTEKTINTYKDISYNLKNYFTWSMLLPSRLNTVFEINDKNQIKEKILKSGSISIMDVLIKEKEIIKDDKKIMIKEKLSNNDKLDNGFNIDEAKIIINYLVAGNFKINKVIKKIKIKIDENDTDNKDLLSKKDQKNKKEIKSKKYNKKR